VRHRGKSPQQAGFFMRSGRAREESALLASGVSENTEFFDRGFRRLLGRAELTLLEPA